MRWLKSEEALEEADITGIRAGSLGEEPVSGCVPNRIPVILASWGKIDRETNYIRGYRENVERHGRFWIN